MHRFDCHPFTAQERLDIDRHLQQVFVTLSRAGPASLGYAIATMIDHLDLPADEVFGFLSLWRAADVTFKFDPPGCRPKRRHHLRLVARADDGP